MGMFDYINYECACPRCHNKVDEFQSKDGDCELKKLEPSQVRNFYSSCNVCGAWIEFNAKSIEPAVYSDFEMKPLSKKTTKNRG